MQDKKFINESFNEDHQLFINGILFHIFIKRNTYESSPIFNVSQCRGFKFFYIVSVRRVFFPSLIRFIHKVKKKLMECNYLSFNLRFGCSMSHFYFLCLLKKIS